MKKTSDFILVKGIIFKKSNIRRIEKITETEQSRYGGVSYTYFYINIIWFNGIDVVNEKIRFLGRDRDASEKERDAQFEMLLEALV